MSFKKTRCENWLFLNLFNRNWHHMRIWFRRFFLHRRMIWWINGGVLWNLINMMLDHINFFLCLLNFQICQAFWFISCCIYNIKGLWWSDNINFSKDLWSCMCMIDCLRFMSIDKLFQNLNWINFLRLRTFIFNLSWLMLHQISWIYHLLLLWRNNLRFWFMFVLAKNWSLFDNRVWFNGWCLSFLFRNNRFLFFFLILSLLGFLLLNNSCSMTRNLLI